MSVAQNSRFIVRSQNQETERCVPLVYVMKERDCPPGVFVSS